jgi:hypothetical protein
VVSGYISARAAADVYGVEMAGTAKQDERTL